MTPALTLACEDELCVGRAALCERLITSSLQNGLTLFFGGPQSGKYTTLRSLADRWNTPRESTSTSIERFAVLLDLRTAPMFDSDRAFYAYALDALWSDIYARLPDLRLPPVSPTERARTSCHWFFDNLRSLVRASPALDFQIVLVVHRADYLLGQRYSEVLERNMVSFFRNSDSREGRGIGSQSRVGLILSGGAKLYAQSHNPDLHSPLRGVHQREYCVNLASASVSELVRIAASDASDEWVSATARAVFDRTGGQAALTRRLTDEVVSAGVGKASAVSHAVESAASSMHDVAVQLLYDSHEDLLRCGPSAKITLEALRGEPRLSEPQLRGELSRHGLMETLYQQAGESVAMCGFATWDRDLAQLTRCNTFFWPELSSRTAATLDLGTAEREQFVFARNRKFPMQWDIVFQGREITGVSHRTAFIQVATLLRLRGRTFSAMELDSLVNDSTGAVSKDARRHAGEMLDEQRRFYESNIYRPQSKDDPHRQELLKSLRGLKVSQLKLAAEECKNQLTEADAGANQAACEFDDEDWKELQLRLLCVNEILEERSPTATAAASAKRHAYKRVREGIDRAIKYFETKDPEFGVHLRSSLWPDLTDGETRQKYCYRGEFPWTAE